MQKKLQIFVILMVALFCLPTNSNAQLPDYSYAEDFTITDINGTVHNLYTYLDEGKYVLLDLSATWCPPCWSYHQAHILNDVHNMYGPEGTDEMVVIMIEGDASTTAADLAGTGSNTLGNWIDGTDYPIVDGIDGSDLARDLELAFWPTFYLICPNRMIIQDERYSSAAGHYNKTQSFGCDPAEGENNAGMYLYSGFEGEFCGEYAYTPELEVINMGTEVMTSATIEMNVNGEVVQTMDWTGSVASLGKADVVLEDLMVAEDSDISFQITNVNGVEDANTADNILGTVVMTKTTAQVGSEVTIEIRTDTYGCESRWVLINSNDGTIAAEGGNPAVGTGGQRIYGATGCGGVSTGYGANMTFTETAMIPENGCYEFKMYDDYGDGICCDYGAGYVRITAADGTILMNTGSFGVELRDLFIGETEVVSVGELEGTAIDIQPNPTQGLVDVLFSGETISDVNIQVFSVSGQLMQQKFYGGVQTNVQLDLSDYTNGLYMVKLTNQEKSLTSKIVLSK